MAAREARRAALPVVTPLVTAWMLELQTPLLVLDRIRNHPSLTDVQRRTAMQEVLRLGLEAQGPVEATTPPMPPSGAPPAD